MLRARPDVLVDPQSSCLRHVAVRLCRLAGVEQILERCDLATMQVAEALQAATGRTTDRAYYPQGEPGVSPLSRVPLIALTAVPADGAGEALETVLRRLREQALVWPIGEGMLAVHPALDSLARRRRQRGDSAASTHIALPARPRPATALVADSGQLEAEAAATAATSLAHVSALLKALAAAPVRCIAKGSGGVSLAEVRRLANQAGYTAEAARLWLHVAAAADLVRTERVFRFDDQQRLALNAEVYPEWAAALPASQLTALIGAWWRMETLPGGPRPPLLIHRYGPDVRPPSTLSSDAHLKEAPTLRQAVFAALRLLPSGHAVTSGDDLAGLLRWARPRWFRPLDEQTRFSSLDHDDRLAPQEVLAAVLAEAERLGLVVCGALSPLGDTLAVGGPGAVAELAERIWRVTTTATIQADHTVLVVGLPAPGLVTLLDSCADLESSDLHARIWRVSPASVRRYLDTGASAEDLLTALAGVAPFGIPQVIRYLISDAGRRFGHVRVSAGICVETVDEATATQILTDPAMNGLQPRRIGPTALVCAGDVKTVLARLRASGYAPVAQTVHGAPVQSTPPPAPPSAPLPASPGGKIDPPAHGDSTLDQTAADAIDRLAALIGDEVEQEPPQGVAADIAAAAPILSADDCRALAAAVADRSPIVIEYGASSGAVTATIRRPGLERRYGTWRLVSLRTNGQPDHRSDVPVGLLERVLTPPKSSRTRRDNARRQ
ncbi:helicase-associated domain-containing protein [Nonomuraea sp. NPDC003707]